MILPQPLVTADEKATALFPWRTFVAQLSQVVVIVVVDNYAPVQKWSLQHCNVSHVQHQLICVHLTGSA